MEQFDRLLQILKENKDTYKMKEIFEIFGKTFEGWEKTSKTCQAIKSKVTKGEWNSFINGLTMSFFLTLHASKMPLEEAIKLADTEGIIGVGVMEIKDDGN